MTASAFTPAEVLVLALAPEHYYRTPLLAGTRQLFIGPDVQQENHQGPHLCLRLQPHWLDGRQLAPVLQQLGFSPDLVLVKADASCRNHLRQLQALPGRKVLLMGDTHHLPQPLQTMLGYALAEPWDLISSEHDRHHLSWCAEAGLNQLIWLPCYTINPHRLAPQAPQDPRAVFVGSLSPHHRQRQRLLEALPSHGLNPLITGASQAQAAQLYNRHLVSLNVSLNADLNFRIFEILAAGGCLLTDRLGPDAGLDQLLVEGQHYLAYSTPAEAAAQVQRLQANPGLRQAIASAGHQLYWEQFSPQQQTKALLAALSGVAIPSPFQAPA